MALLSLRDISMSFGQAPVLEDVSLQIEPGERICLIGRNGEGKTTLMRIINGELEPLTGEVVRQPGIKIAMLDQKVPADISGSVYDVIANGLGDKGILLKEYHEVSRQLAETGVDELLARLDRIQHKVEAEGAWHAHQLVDTIISQLKLDADAEVSTLSAGLKRRVLLGRALALEPDLLMLDEPTNHLDVDSIVWLEGFLEKAAGTLLFVTHDRMFLRKLSTRIVDVDRGRVKSWQCRYDDYVERKQTMLEAEARENEQFDKKLSQEEVWIRKGIQGRRTRNEGRVRELMKMREQRRGRRKVVGKVRMQAHQAEVSGEMVVQALGIDFTYPGGSDLLVKHFTTMIMRGDKFGVIGPNGSGKTTLLKVLLGELKATDGRLKKGTKLQIAYFDQLHRQLDESKSVWENVADGYSSIRMNGREKNVVGYLQDFLFTPQQARNRVSNLSGGERNRLLLAKLFAKPSNVLVLDEPTNDLDMETLELLEELLVGYTGTVLLVSHDRAFLNNVVTGTFVLEGQGRVKEYVGGYDDWLRQHNQQLAEQAPESVVKEKKTKPKPQQKKKLSYKEQKELEALPVRIEELETEIADLHEQMAKPEFYKQQPEEIAKTADRTKQLEEELTGCYDRWEQLEEQL
ncbi:MAG: ATP-binding cassette domain-containing protein [Planctomycetota bacterium]|jgi:ATP-binding cassette subfamily F protein uup